MTKLNSRSQLLAQLKSMLLRQRLSLFFGGLLASSALLIASLIVLSLFANLIILPVWLKTSLLVIALAANIVVFFRLSAVRLFKGSIEQVATRMESIYPELKGRLIAAIQFSNKKPNDSYSSELIDWNERQVLKCASNVEFSKVVSLSPILRTGRYMLITSALAVALLVFSPGLFSYSYEVYSNATTRVAPPLGYDLIALPSSMEWVKYRDIEIGGVLIGENLPEKATIHHRLAGGNWQRTPLDLRKAITRRTDSGDSTHFATTLRQITRSFEFYVEAGERKSELQSITVVDRPRVSGIKLSVFYPDYTGLEPMVIDENDGSFSAVVGSRVSMQITTNSQVESAKLVFDDSSLLPLEVTGRTATASMVVEKSQSYHLRLKDHLDEVNPDPIEFYITAIPDEYPSVNVLRPGYDANLNEDLVLPLSVRIFDDFGFSSLVMKYTVVSEGRESDENVVVLHYSERIKTEGEVSFNWDMLPLDLFPGDYVVYYFEVADNDRITGPKLSRSRKYIARLPSLDELITDVESENEVRLVQTEELLKSGKELARQIKQATRKLEAERRPNKQSDWQNQKELEAIAEKNSNMLEKIEKMADKMQNSLEKMQENSLLSRQIMEKMKQIQKLFQEVATPEMREAQKKLMEALKNMDKQQLQKAIKDFQLSQKELLERLERTEALLKKMAVEQKMDAMMRKAEQLLKKQEQMNARTDSASSSDLPSMKKEEDALAKELEALKKDAKEFEKLLKDAEMQDSPEAKKFSDAVKKTKAGENMKKMSESLKKQQKENAKSEGEKAESKLADMLGEMQKQQMAMQGGDSEEIKKAMRRAIKDSNYLSKNQEELLKEAAALNQRSTMLREKAISQQDLVSACNSLKNSINELGKKSPFVAAELQSLVNKATQEMDLARQEFENKNGSAGTQSQRNAMSNLDRASMRMMESLDEQNQCDKASNCNSGMAKLESLSKKQSQLNEQTKNQCDNPGSKPGSGGQPKMGEALQRLAGEQGTIRKSIEQLAQEFGNSRQVLGRLDDIAREMKDIEESMAEGNVGEDVQKRQLKVLSRMFEASRSLQRRDYTENRKANSPEGQPFYVPKSLTDDILNDKTQLEDRLREFLGSGYPPQYEEQIKAYFRALLKQQSSTSGESSSSRP